MAAATPVLQLLLGRPDPDALGGVAVHVAALCLHAPPGVTPFTAYPSAGDLLVEAWSPRRLVAALPLSEAGAEAALAAALGGTGARVLHVHSPAFGPDAIVQAKSTAGVLLSLALHDHALVCENYELLEGGDRYCGVPADMARCDRCLSKTLGRPPGAVLGWRDRMRRLVDSADAVVAPSRSVLEHAARVHPSIVQRTHRIPWGVPPARARRETPATHEGPLRAAIVGVFAKVKGASMLPALLAACRHLDVEWHLFGATEGASLARLERSAGRVFRHGAYRRSALAERLVAAKCDLVVLPSVGAETFSLTLSEVAAAGFPVLASDLGALGERVRDEGLGWVFDPFVPRSFADRVACLSSDRSEVERVARHVRTAPHRDEARMAADHAELWTTLAAHAPRLPSPGGAAGQALRDARMRFERGIEHAARRRPSRLDALFDRVKKTDFYRNLGLRRLLPERTRKAIEHALRRPSYRSARAKDPR